MATHLSGPGVEPAVVIYGVNVLLATVLLSLLMYDVIHEPGLLIDEVADETLAAMTWQRWALIGLDVIAIAIALVFLLAAVGLYVLVTLLLLALPLLAMHRHRGRAGVTKALESGVTRDRAGYA